jgi:hypothetical protein
VGVSLQSRMLLTWVALAGITLLAWWMGARHGAGVPQPDAAVACGAIAITIIKVRVILREFMEVRHAPARLRHVTDAWLAVFAAAMLLAYFT